MNPIGRRTLFKGAAAAVVLAGAGAALSACGDDQPEPQGYEGERRRLPVPPLDEGEMVDGERVFHLDAGAHEVNVLPEKKTRVWGFNGGHLGPTLYMRRGDRVRMHVHNGLDTMTTIHWHGMKLPAVSDGGPHSRIEPGETWEPGWTVEQPAATLWYHPHPHMETELHAYRGLAGGIVIADDVADGLDLPHEYGVDDIPVVLMDQKFNEDGSLNEGIDPDLGLKGDTPTVNGITAPTFEATTKRLRLRLLDAATMRFFNLAFEDGRKFQLVATDSGLLDVPETLTELRMSPGERAEVVVELEEGETTMLKAVPFEENMDVPEDEYSLDFGLKDTFELLEITAADSLAEPAGPVPEVLDPTAAEEPDVAGAPERDFALNTFEINGRTMDMSRVDLTIDHDGPEVWTVTNENTDWIHNFHIHNSRFRILEVKDTDVPVPTTGWRDTVQLPPGATARLAVEFGHYPDPEWAYMYHCHMLLHEDSGMMGQFVMTEPEQEPRLNPVAYSEGLHEDHAAHAH
ncbi:multicopper oxidase family protein [Corynebacterium frankenforstense]